VNTAQRGHFVRHYLQMVGAMLPLMLAVMLRRRGEHAR
jgi:hypothetical protein